jgi:capsid protein
MPTMKVQRRPTRGRQPQVKAEAYASLLQMERKTAFNEVMKLRGEIKRIRARYDAAQTVTGNINHWAQADNLDPHGAASLEVRRTLRSRARYEVIENNSYLKGTLLTITNDFVGKGGPRLQITDSRLSRKAKQTVEKKFKEWYKVSFMRQKLWRLKLAKMVDGESFMRAYANKNRLREYPVQLDFQVLECDRISSQASMTDPPGDANEIDGVRFDNYENPLKYHILNQHPTGSGWLNKAFEPIEGLWADAKYVIHWFRQDRGWLRGIPELAASLPLCALLRRYTLAIVRHSETAADFSAVLETELPPGQTPWTDGQGGELYREAPFDIFPVEMGMIMNLPYGHKLNQLKAVPLGVEYDAFVGALLREITRPILAPYGIAAGTSKDSNMASAVVDQHIYKSGQVTERAHCEESVLDRVFDLWWFEASRIPGYLGVSLPKEQIPEHSWQWDRVGLDHTDPSKVAQAIETLHNKRLLTDRDFQEEYMNRDVDTWRDEIKEDDEFRKDLEDSGMQVQPKQEGRQAKQAEKQATLDRQSTEKVAKDRNKQMAKKAKQTAKKPAAKKKAAR